ncbi:hypothetical protein BJ742DRAFT_839404 [Cladochytrium replicatum]|nr:hypothetical protein BJ742DRAFT_839404 [Cladochytrium replicatum]
MHMLSVLKIAFFALSITHVFVMAQITDGPDSTSLNCECYCCPSSSNPRGFDASCNAKDPPLAGTVKVSVGAATMACNAESCSAWYALPVSTEHYIELIDTWI